MLVVISPSLTMSKVDDNFKELTIPQQISKVKEIVKNINSLSYEEFKTKLSIKDKLAELNIERYKNFKFDNLGSAAILSYTGTAYKSIKAHSFSYDEMEFAGKNLRILSGLYGVLRPYDSIYEYRLEMKTPICINNSKNLYEYFGDSIYNNIVKDDREIINLCSEEYSKNLSPYIGERDRFITCSFKIKKGNVLRSLSTDAKKTRGLMVNFIVKNKIENKEYLKEFNDNGYEFNKDLSNDSEYVFVK